MKKLLKEYGFNSDMQYFEMIVESVVNGQRKQAVNQFAAMPKQYRKQFVLSLVKGYWSHSLNSTDIEMFIVYDYEK